MLAEAVVNAVRHGRAGVIKVGITKTRQDVTMRICDDGRGFEDASFSHSDQDAVQPESDRSRCASASTNWAVCLRSKACLPVSTFGSSCH